jgi:hypothetical protein
MKAAFGTALTMLSVAVAAVGKMLPRFDAKVKYAIMVANHAGGESC